MPMFVPDDRVPVTVDGTNTIYIRAKMPFGVRQKVLGAMAGINDEGKAELRLGEYNITLMTANVLAWTGPEFAGVECTPENIARLDPDEPLVDAVLGEIARRNPIDRDAKAARAEKKGRMSAGAPPSTAGV